MLNGYADEGAAFLNISACDPEALRGVDPDRLTRASRSETAIQPYVNAVMSNGCLVRRLRPHSELGEEGLPRRLRGRGDGQALGRDLHLRPHQRQG